jgi:hypothetical protein
VECLLSNNFDVESATCLITLCKLIDNILKTSPNDSSKRTLNLSNATLQQKIFGKQGGSEFLSAIGFQKQSNDDTKIQLYHQDNDLLLSARSIILQYLTNHLSCPSEKLPSLQPPPIYRPPPGSGSSSNNNRFNPYQTQNYNTQAATRGGTNPILQKDRKLSTTERQLQLLQNKQTKLERQIQTSTTTDRNILAFHNHQHYAFYTSFQHHQQQQQPESTASVSDGSLIASQMKRMEEERKKREDGGFTTKAMRDLERMKKQKVYSHVQLRINFPDGSFLTAKFLPRETVQDVLSVIQSCLISEMEFDVFASPPRRVLSGTKTLSQEGLVPAAKLHVSWKGVFTQPLSQFLKSELFPPTHNENTHDAKTNPMVLYPDAKPIAEEETNNKIKSNNTKQKPKANRQDAMLRKMMGKSSTLLRRGGGDSGDNNGSDNKGPPKWFKK